MGDGTKESPYTHEDVLRLIKEHGGTAEGLDLSERVFEKGVDLSKLDLEGIILSNAVLDHANFQKSRLWHADFREARLDYARFEGAELYFAHLESAVLWFSEFSYDTRLEDIDWGSYVTGEEINGNYAAARITYRRLKIWHTNAGMYDIAADFYYREMEVKRKFAQEQIHKLFKEYKVWQSSRFLFKGKDFGNWVRLWLYRLTCGYGERPWQVFAGTTVVVLGLAIVYFAIGTLTPNTFLDSLYYSAASFIALGYGSWVKEATGWVKGLGVFEAFIGVFMMALFLVTFTRKMTR